MQSPVGLGYLLLRWLTPTWEVSAGWGQGGGQWCAGANLYWCAKPLVCISSPNPFSVASFCSSKSALVAIFTPWKLALVILQIRAPTHFQEVDGSVFNRMSLAEISPRLRTRSQNLSCGPSPLASASSQHANWVPRTSVQERER